MSAEQPAAGNPRRGAGRPSAFTPGTALSRRSIGLPVDAWVKLDAFAVKRGTTAAGAIAIMLGVPIAPAPEELGAVGKRAEDPPPPTDDDFALPVDRPNDGAW